MDLEMTLASLLVASFVYGAPVLAADAAADAQVSLSLAAKAFAIHDDLLKCYQALGKSAETDAEFRWILSSGPVNAVYHFNYACFLQRAGKTALASEQYKLAAVQEPSRVDYVGSYGQMLFFQQKYIEACQYIGRASQMPGGEKYKASLEVLRHYVYGVGDFDGPLIFRKPGPPGSKKPKDDDDE